MDCQPVGFRITCEANRHTDSKLRRYARRSLICLDHAAHVEKIDQPINHPYNEKYAVTNHHSDENNQSYADISTT